MNSHIPQKICTFPRMIHCAFVFVISLSFINVLELIVVSKTADKVHFQSWTSDTMQQLLPIKELQISPLNSLWYLHKTPPAVDIIRALLAQLYSKEVTQEYLLINVDKDLYIVWSFFYALMCMLIFIWIAQIANIQVGYIGSFIWMIHPAPLAFSTLLETTLLSSIGVLWFFYCLWNFKLTPSRSPLPLILSTAALFYTRAFFQWYFIPEVILSLVFLGANKTTIFRYFLGVSLCIGPYMIKQYYLFNTVETFSVGGYHYCGFLWYHPSTEEISATRNKLHLSFAENSIASVDPFNTIKQTEDNIVYKTICLRYAVDHPLEAIENIFKSINQNFLVALRPSSRYSQNVLVDSLPYRNQFDMASSGIISCLILALCSFYYCANIKSWLSIKKTIGFLIPFIYTLAFILLGNRYEWVESDRLKFFLEPLFFIFIISQVSIIFSTIFNYWLHKSLTIGTSK